MEHRSDRKRPQRHAEQVLAVANQGEDGVQQAQRIQSRRHAQPEDAHISHRQSG